MKKKLILLGILACSLAFGVTAQPGARGWHSQRSYVLKHHPRHERMARMQLHNQRRQHWNARRHEKHIRKDGIVTPREQSLIREHRKATMRRDHRRKHVPHR